ncbi:hypothetical protein ABB37_01984 [Leptomonas pyrrhocoris]|uniref:BRCT domain-containing protein n=1 Tax=Leptomonas pyrrhocoris TaxID=157538 RepID=A0A0N0DY51_LEPPY|nr:hypothetical protein ABB37_01984 [Leptomonas pyrrhocoris]XP_015662184.1 hypothetical protein ABB37_01984 [Leptomonas pyrrhocoris]KPA83744.1 hypothetical protein ABB37_01984 [Leptomonas pyrrhocoris]KPA83745.1 hypothetical protein ABB37_01984 [Leptomonas pyrrhocoris]|eukprot:XP_015662183.1 hypothetical protein ABB37_01984 [Leptomonas pyrrhocoris]
MDTQMDPSQRRFTDSLSNLDDAETVELLSQDSGSTVSSTPPLRDSCSEDAAWRLNAPEEQLRRRAEHHLTSVPELRRAQDWNELINPAESKNGFTAVSATSAPAWADAHPNAAVIFLRWHAYPSSLLADKASWASPWVPYTASLPALCSSSAGGVADTHTAITATPSSGGLDSGVHAQQTHPMGTVQLRIGRSALTDCATESDRLGSEERAVVREAAASISRVHCAVHLNFTRANRSTTLPAGDNAERRRCCPTSPRCQSFDVCAVSPATSLNGVPLHPHHRYHLHTEDASCCPDGVVTLKLGPLCSVDVALRGPSTSKHGSPAQERALGSLALHRPPPRQPPPATRDRPTAALTRSSTTSLMTGESTVVLATLSDLSEPVALSDGEGEEVSDRQPLLQSPSEETVAAQALLDDAHNDRVPPLSKRRKSAKPSAKPASAIPANARRSRLEVLTDEDDDDDSDAAVSAVPAPSEFVLFTTGLRLSDEEERELKVLGALVNPHLRFARHAQLLVARTPLARSVKLLTVLPFVHTVVQQSWLDTVLHTHSLAIPLDGFRYSERKLPGSIESENNFDLRETLAKEPQDRQKLLSGQRFWVHKAATPQDPPLNDLKTVLAASGGVATRRVSDANVLIMPQQRPALKCWKSLLEEVGGAAALAQRRQSGLLLVAPDDVFRCVLQQRPLTRSTVVIPRTQLSGLRADNDTSRGRASSSNASSKKSCGGRRSSQGTRKTQRSSTSQRSPRAGTRRRSS